MIGSIVLATDQGLGYLAKDFYDHGIVHKVLIRPHSSRVNHKEWYKPEDRVNFIEELLNTCTTLLFFETPFEWDVIRRARERGIKTVLMPMYECTNYPFPYVPDVIIAPSALDADFYAEYNPVQINVPVNVPWKLRKKAKVFVHNAGNGGIGGRNGTKELIDAMEYVTAPIKLIIRSQIPLERISDDQRIEYRVGQFDDIWSEGDVFVFPEKFNGLSLPLQEAFASGMAVMAGDRFPMNTWLPKNLLIPVEKYFTAKISISFSCAKYNEQIIASCINKLYNADITNYSLLGKAYAERNSWEKLKEQYETVLSPL